MPAPSDGLLQARVAALTEKPRSVLALAAIARLWQEQFPGSWITQAHVAQHSLHFERLRAGEASEANRIGFVRARNTICEAFPELLPEQDVVQGVAAIRLGVSAPDNLREWVVVEAPLLLERAFWESYLAQHEPWQTWLAVVEATVVTRAKTKNHLDIWAAIEVVMKVLPTRASIKDEMWDAAVVTYAGLLEVRAPSRVARPDTFPSLLNPMLAFGAAFDPRYIRFHLEYLRLMLAIRYDAPPLKALHLMARELDELIANPIPIRIPADQLLMGRIYLTRAAFDQIIGLAEQIVPDAASLDKRRSWLERAGTQLQHFALSDRSGLCIQRGLLILDDARCTASFSEARAQLWNAERCFQDAFALAQNGTDFQTMSLALQYQAACVLQMSIVDGHTASKEREFVVRSMMRCARDIHFGDAADLISPMELGVEVAHRTLYRAARDIAPVTHGCGESVPFEIDVEWTGPVVKAVFGFARRDYACFSNEAAATGAGSKSPVGKRNPAEPDQQ